MSSDTTEHDDADETECKTTQARAAAQNEGPPLDERLRRQREPLDFSPPSTAVEPSSAAQDVSETAKTGRHAYTENATFTMEELPASSDRWASLNQANRDFYASDEKTVGREQQKQDYVNDTAAWGGQIGLTDHEIDRAAHLVLEADSGFHYNHSSAAIVLAALTLAANESRGTRRDTGKEIRQSSPMSDRTPELAMRYETIRDDLGVSRKSVTKCRKHLREIGQ